MRVPIVESASHEVVKCPCGCNREFGILTGNVNFDEGPSVPFVVGRLRCESGGPNMWIALRMDPLSDDPRACWITMHLWDDGENIVTTIIDGEDSPLADSGHIGERLLSRELVVSQPGAREFAIAARLRIVENVSALKDFFHEEKGA
jgi:hypothetical protein